MINKDIKEQKTEDGSANPNKNFICTMEIKSASFKLLCFINKESVFKGNKEITKGNRMSCSRHLKRLH